MLRFFWESGEAMKMQAAIFRGPGRIGIERLPLPGPAAGQVLVALEGCGVCGSNLPVFQGRPWFSYPLAPGCPGHEGWGRVVALGAEVERNLLGRRVSFVGQAGYASHELARAADLLLLPPELDGKPFPGEPLGCAMNIFARSGIEAGQSVAIVGLGFQGLLLTSLAVAAGARVIAISRRSAGIEEAARRGAVESLACAAPQRVVGRVSELTGGRMCERVIEAAGLQATLDLATSLAAVRGRLIIAGYHQDGPRQVDLQRWNWQGLDVVNAHERDPAVYLQGMASAAAAVGSGRLDPFSLFTHRLPLASIGEAFGLLRDRPDSFIKALITYDA
jgi:2-desacetyl-2-hydroxyethyl bacteriochlorophyllide A dehydrogenase